MASRVMRGGALAAQHLRVLQKRLGSDVRVELLSSLVKRTRDETASRAR